MVTTRLWILGTLAGLTLVAGCGSSHLGTYEGYQDFKEAPANMKSAGNIKVVLHSTGRFLFLRASMPWEGDWSESDGRILLKVDSAMNMPAAPKGAILLPQKDGSLLLKDEYTPESGIVLKRTGASE